MKRAAVVASLLLAACVTTYKFQRVEGEVPSIHPTMWQELNCTGLEVNTFGDGGCAQALRPTIACSSDPSRCLRTPGTNGPPLDVKCGALKSELSFVHLSNAKLREHRLLLAADDESPTLADPLDQLRRNDDAALLALVLGANQFGRYDAGVSCVPLSEPRFLLHTGNAVGSGLFSEALQFIAAMDQSQVPWFNALGPNDVTFLGDLPNERVEGLNVVVPYVPIVDGDRFMQFHSKKFGVANEPALPSPVARALDHVPTTNGCRVLPGHTSCQYDGGYPVGSAFHGFDLACDAQQAPLCSKARGAWSFDSASPSGSGRRFRVIVLNTVERVVDDGTSGTRGGRMLPEQVRWLHRQLDTLGPDTFALVFGHHGLELFEGTLGAELRDALAANPRVLGYFHGGRVGDFQQHPRDGGLPLAEFGASSTFDFPQLARSVDVLSDGARLYVRLASFHAPFTFSDAGLPSDDSPYASGVCEPLSEGVSFCARLARRAGRARTAAEALVTERDQLERALSNANGLVQVYGPP